VSYRVGASRFVEGQLDVDELVRRIHDRFGLTGVRRSAPSTSTEFGQDTGDVPRLGDLVLGITTDASI
jgi:hypothetical protein